MKLPDNIPYKIYEKIDISSIQNLLKNLNSQLWEVDISRQNQHSNPHKQTNSLILQYCFGEPVLEYQGMLDVDKDYLKMFPAQKMEKGRISLARKYRRVSTAKSFLKDISEIKANIVDIQLNTLTQVIVKELEKRFNGISGLVLYTKLASKKAIEKHIDPGFYLSVIHRLHIPIITNDKCIFNIDNNILNMKEGYLYELNNLLEHSVENNGDNDRIHLIIDIIPNSLIEQLTQK